MTLYDTSQKSYKALISTIEPIDGGVPSMTRWLCTLLEEIEIEPTLAWYAPYRNYPYLSAPLYGSIFKRENMIQKTAFSKYMSFGIGAKYPEFEFTHYLPSKYWKALIAKHHLHFVVSGNVLAATPYFFMKTPFLAWIATPWEADRKDRVQTFNQPRRFFDSAINRPFLKILEQQILKSPSSDIISLSSYTSKELSQISRKPLSSVMLMPVDTNIYSPLKQRVVPWKIGFSGRYCDPRKNIKLLLDAIKILRNSSKDIQLVLVGDKDYESMKGQIEAMGLTKQVTCYPHMDPHDLSRLLQSLDLFVIPSHQEGLCISALEAMASGVPVISTRCGGPEDYVIPGRTGYFVDYYPSSLAQAILKVCSNRIERDRLSNAAVAWVRESASKDASRKIFRKHLSELMDRLNLKEHYLATTTRME